MGRVNGWVVWMDEWVNKLMGRWVMDGEGEWMGVLDGRVGE